MSYTPTAAHGERIARIRAKAERLKRAGIGGADGILASLAEFEAGRNPSGRMFTVDMQLSVLERSADWRPSR